MTTSITSLPSASVPLTGTERVPMDQTIGSAVAASALVVGTGYRIESLGTTNWTACGLPAGVTAAVGLTFVATAAGTGTGTAVEAQTVEATAAAIAALAPATNLTYDPATRLLSSSTGTDVTLPLATDALDGLQSAAHRALVQALIAAGVMAAGSTVTIPHIHGDIAGSLYIHIKNTSGGTLTKGTPLRITGQVGDTSVLEVAAANSASAATMPAFGVLSETIANNDPGHAVVAGGLLGLNTAGLTQGTILYVAAGGGWTATRPTSGVIQQIAIVGRVHASTGGVTVTVGSLQSPNWDTAYSERLQWDGGATGLNAATGRASLELTAAATATIGTAAGNLVALDGSARLPAVDGSQLTGLPSAPVTSVAGRTGAVTLAVGDVANAVATSDARLSDARTPLAHNQPWGSITETPTTLSGYGITDALSTTATRAANLVLAGPASGAAAAPTFRALVAADLPAVPAEIGLACSDETTALTTGPAKVTFRMPYAMTVTAVRASVTTAPTGSTLVVDINEGGTSILSTKLSIDATEKTSTTAATPAVISDTALADDAEITIDIDQIGSTVAGAGLKVWIIGRRA
jgi:hypothetical protein